MRFRRLLTKWEPLLFLLGAGLLLAFPKETSAYALEGGFDAILINYSLADFVADTSVFLMGT